ncbi:hypothetical protein R6Q59_016999 [Mikania micrantha]
MLAWCDKMKSLDIVPIQIMSYMDEREFFKKKIGSLVNYKQIGNNFTRSKMEEAELNTYKIFRQNTTKSIILSGKTIGARAQLEKIGIGVPKVGVIYGQWPDFDGWILVVNLTHK